MHELTKDVEERPAAAKKRIIEAFAASGYDYNATAEVLGLHHYTLRKCARRLKITKALSRARTQAVKRGELPDDSGRPRKPVPPSGTILKAYAQSKCVLEDTAVVLGVTPPTLRRWIRENPDLLVRLARVRDAA